MFAIRHMRTASWAGAARDFARTCKISRGFFHPRRSKRARLRGKLEDFEDFKADC